MFEANEESPEKVSAQNTLYTCLEGGLKLLHPFMPYVTEDLWQRLPRRAGDDCKSIMISAFPEAVSLHHTDRAFCSYSSSMLIEPDPRAELPRRPDRL